MSTYVPPCTSKINIRAKSVRLIFKSMASYWSIIFGKWFNTNVRIVPVSQNMCFHPFSFGWSALQLSRHLKNHARLSDAGNWSWNCNNSSMPPVQIWWIILGMRCRGDNEAVETGMRCNCRDVVAPRLWNKTNGANWLVVELSISIRSLHHCVGNK